MLARHWFTNVDQWRVDRIGLVGQDRIVLSNIALRVHRSVQCHVLLGLVDGRLDRSHIGLVRSRVSREFPSQDRRAHGTQFRRSCCRGVVPSFFTQLTFIANPLIFNLAGANSKTDHTPYALPLHPLESVGAFPTRALRPPRCVDA